MPVEAPDFVVGSGPAGVACASALLEKGRRVVMLDAGIAIEEFRAKIVDQLKATPPVEWDPALVAKLKENMEPDKKGIPLKLSFGSDFPYRDSERHIPSERSGVALRPSLAVGGHSNVWGAVMLPYAEADLEDWPIKRADLARHYEAAIGITGLAGRRDDLEELFPLYAENPPALAFSRQAANLKAALEKNRSRLRDKGVRFGAARLAVEAPCSPGGTGCIYCGLCMYGCPYGYIYNSAATLLELKARAGFSYVPDIIVQRFHESAGSVLIEGYHRETGEAYRGEADRLFLAAGVIPTTKILLESMGAYDQTLRIRDSQYFLLPFLLKNGAPDVRKEALHTLSQLFIEISDPALSAHLIHLQMYSYSDLITGALRKSLGPLGRIDPLVRGLESRLMVAQCYLHSDLSQSIAMTLRKSDGKGPAALELKAETSSQTRATIRKLIRKLLFLSPMLGALPLFPMLQMGEAGRGFHSGGTFPMRENPGAFECDVLGRPAGLQRVHAVDSTVFPTIPATTITISSMANAHRIGWESCC